MRLLDTVKDFDIELFVPNDVKSLANYRDLLLVDDEGLEILKRCMDVGRVNYYLISDDASIYRFIVRAFGIEDVKVLQVGVDAGRRLAYVILSDNLLLKAGYIARLEDLIEIINRFRKFLTPAKVVVKLGSSTGNDDNKLDTLMKGLVRSGFEVIVADERNSSSRLWNPLSGYKTKFTTDMYAALNIVFREGVKVSMT